MNNLKVERNILVTLFTFHPELKVCLKNIYCSHHAFSINKELLFMSN